MLVPSTSKNMATLISSHLFQSLCVSSSFLFSLWCRRLCRAALGGGGQGVSRRSSGLGFPKGFTLKRCCSTTERIVLSRKLDKIRDKLVGNLNFENNTTFFLLASSITRTSMNYMRKGPKSTYSAASGARGTGYERWLKEKQEGRRWVAATENRWWLQATEQHFENSSSSTSCSGRSRRPVCMSELFPQCGLTEGPQRAALLSASTMGARQLLLVAFILHSFSFRRREILHTRNKTVIMRSSESFNSCYYFKFIDKGVQ